jgi:hypothetical protein
VVEGAFGVVCPCPNFSQTAPARVPHGVSTQKPEGTFVCMATQERFVPKKNNHKNSENFLFSTKFKKYKKSFTFFKLNIFF